MVRANEDEDGKSAVAADVVLLDRLQWVGSSARCWMTARERQGVRVLQGRGEMAGYHPRVRWVMAVGVVVRGMTACLIVAAAHCRRR